MKRIILTVAFALALYEPTLAKEPTKSQKTILKNTETVQVEIYDDVKDGCWKSPNAAKTVIEKELLSSNIPLKKSIDSLILSLSVVGVALKSRGGDKTGCAVHLRMQAWYSGLTKTPNKKSSTFATVVAYSRGRLVAGLGDQSKQITDKAREWAAEFAVLWLKSRQSQEGPAPAMAVDWDRPTGEREEANNETDYSGSSVYRDPWKYGGELG
jgi:hypothetical protein